MQELKLSASAIEDKKYAELLLRFEKLQRHCNWLQKELDLYKSQYSRPKIIKEIIHHPAIPRDSQCPYGRPAYDEVVYE